jgi:uncharacterized membrane protein
MPTFALLGMIIVSLFGLADASYITYEKFAHVVPTCVLTGIFKCSTVLESPWASIGPVPLSLLGMGFYATVFLLASYLLLKKDAPAKLSTLLFALSVFGFGFSLYLTGIQAFIIKAFCFFCVLSAVSSSLLFVIGWLGHRQMIKASKVEE